MFNNISITNRKLIKNKNFKLKRLQLENLVVKYLNVESGISNANKSFSKVISKQQRKKKLNKFERKRLR